LRTIGGSAADVGVSACSAAAARPAAEVAGAGEKAHAAAAVTGRIDRIHLNATHGMNFDFFVN
jgi:hypothetical protein